MPKSHALPSIPTKILLPVDFSPSSHAALDMAADLAKHFHAELHLVNVVPILPFTSIPDLIPEGEFIREIRTFAEQHMPNALLLLQVEEWRPLPVSKSVMTSPVPSWK